MDMIFGQTFGRIQGRYFLIVKQTPKSSSQKIAGIFAKLHPDDYANPPIR